MKQLFKAFHTRPDTSVSLEQALTDRMRRGVLLSATVGISTTFLFAVIDSWWQATNTTYQVSRVVLGFTMIFAALVARGAVTYSRTTIAAGMLSASLLTHAFLNIVEGGGAKSASAPTFPIAVMIMTYTVPMPVRRMLIIYPTLLAIYVGVIAACSPDATPHELVNAYRWGFLTIAFSMAGAWLSYRVLRDTYEWRKALREESRHSALALERARIARDLHDHIGARLTGIALRAEREQERGDNSKEALVWIQDTVRLCLEELRDTIWALSSAGRDSRELVATLRRRAEDITDAADLHLEWHMDPDKWHGRLSSGVSVALSAIVREALTNTLRHSGAKNVRIVLERDEREIRLEIADDGRGLGQQPSEGRGLGNMRARAKEQRGDVKLESNGEAGVKVVARIPLDERGEGENQ